MSATYLSPILRLGPLQAKLPRSGTREGEVADHVLVFGLMPDVCSGGPVPA